MAIMLESFKQFITEAKLSRKNLDKAADIFKRIYEKKTGRKLFRWGGPRGISHIKGGVAILYMVGGTKDAMRLNYVGDGIQSISLWKNSFSIVNLNADFTIDLGGVGLLDAGKKLIDVLVSPRPGKINLYPESMLAEGFENLNEAKRVKPEEFYSMVYEKLPGVEMSAVEWDQIAAVASMYDVNIPSVIRTFKHKSRGSKLYDLTRLMGARDTGSVAPVTMTVKSGDALSTVSHSPIAVSNGADFERRLNLSITEPNVQTLRKDPDTLFGNMSSLVKLVSRGVKNALIIYGGPGIGKTFVVNQTLAEEGLVENRDYFVIKGKISTAALYQMLFMHRKGSLLVFDDTDSVWDKSSGESANILKAALDSYDVRKISWNSKTTVNVSKMTSEEQEEYADSIDRAMEESPADNHKLPSQFNYEGRIVFISNLSYDKFDSAVLTRSVKIDMTLTQEEIFARIKSILPKIGKKNVSIEDKEMILRKLMDRYKSGTLQGGVSMRLFVAAEEVFVSGLPNWMDLLEYV